MKRMATLAVVLFTMGGVCVSQAHAWKFVVMGDSQGYGGDNTNTVSVATLGDMASFVAGTEQPDLVVFAGDLADPSTSQAAVESALNTWRTTMAPVYTAGIGVYPLRGSHDLGGNTLQSYSNVAWQNVFPGLPSNGPAGEEKMTYSFTHNNATFLALDEWQSMPGTWCTVDTSWVDAQLAANTKRHVFSFTHSQIKRVEHTYCLDQIVPAVRNTLVASLRDAGGKVHFTGHMHRSNGTKLNDDVADPTNSQEEDNFYQVIVAPASQKFYNWTSGYAGNPIPGMTPYNIYDRGYVNGYTVVDIDVYDVTVTFMRKTGPGSYVADGSFSYTVDPYLGDATLDGLVDTQDFTVLKAHFGQDPAEWGDGNFNDDTVVDSQDFTILKAHFGEGTAPEPAPEPATLALLGAAVPFLLKRKSKMPKARRR